MPAILPAPDERDDQPRLPYMARWLERVTNPVGSTKYLESNYQDVQQEH
ncbi:MAG: hypothetical protein QOC76_6185 [Mycobacterium sp.]|jgi:hypothetical protein|nr:hypothetical protein [Mycobacterium sp.]